ncbi:hypothetical protein KSF_041170 [Reticulibacter mediterranei]|uniref:Uncharacterized protein n=1 Tax=Reticulibacter mediterranei TaxID=2778369 RepID=A0A8J3IM19_9CHLR|nr:hypothetical protein [Reticulibacter mediterranei]GHO94069.1 hypothetical protein KSF_041170 [Reticulibacter mediterranei]
MIQHTPSLLRAIWTVPVWRDDLLATFIHWVQDGKSRRDVQPELKGLIEVELTKYVPSFAHDVDLAQVNWDQITEFFCLSFYKWHASRSLLSIPPDEIWEELSDAQTWGPLSFHPQQENAISLTVPIPFLPVMIFIYYIFILFYLILAITKIPINLLKRLFLSVILYSKDGCVIVALY